MSTQTLVSSDAQATGSTMLASQRNQRTFQATVSGTGAVTATVVLEVSNNASDGWVTALTFTLSGTTTATDGASYAPIWPYIRGKITAISGTGATAKLTIGD